VPALTVRPLDASTWPDFARLVEANNGVLSVRNVPGTGCVFTIDLPRHSMIEAAPLLPQAA